MDDAQIQIAVSKSGTGQVDFGTGYKYGITELSDERSILREIKMAASKLKPDGTGSMPLYANAGTMGDSTIAVVQTGTGPRSFHTIINKNPTTPITINGIEYPPKSITAVPGEFVPTSGIELRTPTPGVSDGWSPSQIQTHLFKTLSEVSPEFCHIPNR